MLGVSAAIEELARYLGARTSRSMGPLVWEARVRELIACGEAPPPRKGPARTI